MEHTTPIDALNSSLDHYRFLVTGRNLQNDVARKFACKQRGESLPHEGEFASKVDKARMRRSVR